MICMLSALLALPAGAQFITDRHYFYINGSGGLATYFGDLSSPNKDESFLSYGTMGGLGYVISPSLYAGLDYRIADYPRTLRAGTGKYTRKHVAGVYARYNFIPLSEFTPYVTAGAGLVYYGTFDNSKVFDPGFGPTAGVGVDWIISEIVSMYIESKWDFILDDRAVDNLRGDTGFDMLGYLGAGVRVNLRSSFRPVRGVSIAGPNKLFTREEGIFTAALLESATLPVRYEWDFNDGTIKTGLSVSHRFTIPGSYVVTLIASNQRSREQRNLIVTVTDRPQPARIVNVYASTETPLPRQNILFDAVTEGTAPITYEWDFGDGNVSRGVNPQHSYTSPGEYTVILQVSNTGVAGEDGKDSHRKTIQVLEPPPPRVTELNTVFFGFGSVNLDADARRLLDENIKILKEQPDYCVQIDVFTDSVGNPQANLRLSEQRARIVERYYMDNGIDRERVTRTGLGVAPGPCPPDDPGPGCRHNRRAESIPLLCQ